MRTIRSSRSCAVPEPAMMSRSRRSRRRDRGDAPRAGLPSPPRRGRRCSRVRRDRRARLGSGRRLARAASDARERLADQLVEDLARSLCSRVTMPTLCPAISEPVSTSPSITARRSAPAQKCSISSCASFCDSSPRLKRSITSRCIAQEPLASPALASARTGITGKRGSSCTDGTASRARGADEGLLEARMGDRFMGADEARAELHAGRAHLEIGRAIASPRPMPPATNTGTSREMRQDLLRQHAVETGPIWPPASHALDDDRVGAHAHELLARCASAGAKQSELGAAVLDARDRRGARECRRRARHGRRARARQTSISSSELRDAA